MFIYPHYGSSSFVCWCMGDEVTEAVVCGWYLTTFLAVLSIAVDAICLLTTSSLASSS